MKLTRKSKGFAALATGLAALLLLPTPSYALFGLGDVVFDPTSFATLGHIWTEDISTGVKILQTYNQMVKLYANAVSDYSLARQMSARLQQKQTWIALATRASNEVTQNRYGETVNWSAAMNGDYLHAGMAYGNATTRLNPSIDLSNEQLGQSYQLANLATVESMDASNQTCLMAVAQYRASQQQNQGSSNALTTSVLDEGDGTNSVVAQLNQLNGGGVQQRAEAQSQGTLQACLVEQQVLASAVQRNGQVEAFNTYAQVQRTYNANPMQLSSASASLGADIQ